MDINTFVITPLSGAIIGYFTNWLAIKMLFRPYEEKKIFGIRVPFTPGLMPKERYLLSNKIGQTLADNVLTTEAIMDTVLKNEQTQISIEGYLGRYFEKIMSEPLTVADVIKKIPVGEIELDLLYKRAGDMLVEKIQSPDIIRKLSELIHETIINMAKSKDAVLLTNNLIASLRPGVMELAEKYLKSGAIEVFVSDAIGSWLDKLHAENRTLAEIIPDAAIDIIKLTIKDKLPKLAETIKNLPYNNPKVDFALRELMNRVIDDNIGTVAGFFVNKDKTYSSLRFALFEYLSYHENIEELYEKAEELIDKLLLKNANGILPAGAEQQIREWLSKAVSDNISYELAEKILVFVFNGATGLLEEKSAETIDAIISKFMPGYEARLYNFIESRIGEYIKTNARILVDGAMSMVLTGSEGLQGFRIDKFLKSLGDENLNSAKSSISGLIMQMLEKGLKTLFENIDIAKITEEQINKMDMRQTEELVVSVVNRELKAITYFGGLLGLIIGFVPAILNLLGV